MSIFYRLASCTLALSRFSHLANNNSTTGTATYNKVSLIKEDQDRSLLLTWLPAPNASARQRPSPCPGTGSWFLGKGSVRQWLEGSKSFLWCYGAPGVGKSFLASHVIDHLLETRTPPDYLVLYFFCDFSSQDEQRVIDILHHLLRQVIEQGSTEVLTLLKESCKDPGRLQQAAEVTQLIATAGSTRQIYLVLDAVDELREPTSLLSHITNLVPSGISLLIMSRDVPHIRKKMTLATHLEVDSDPGDLKVYIESRFRDSDFSDEVEEEDKMIGDVASSSGNLYVHLTLDSLILRILMYPGFSLLGYSLTIFLIWPRLIRYERRFVNRMQISIRHSRQRWIE